MNTLNEVNNPIPQGNYVPASRFGNMIYTAGMTPRKNGVLIRTGSVRITEPVSTYKAAVRQSTANALTAAMNTLSKHERLERILSLTVYIQAENPSPSQ